MPESALATFVVFLFDCFVQLMRLTLDLICLSLLLCALCMPWRWPFIPKAVSEVEGRGEFEGMCAGQFFLGIGDLICFCILLIPLCTGLQTGQLCSRLGKSCDWHQGGWYGAALLSFGLLLVDLFFIVFWSITLVVMLILVITIIRLPKFCSKLRRREVRDGWKWGVDLEDKEVSVIPKNFELFACTWGQFGNLLIDLIFVPVFLLIFCSGWRTSTMLAKMREKKGVKKRKAVLQQFGCLLVDLPFVLMGTFTLLTLWRAPLLIAGARKTSGKLTELREVIAEQFALLLRDIPCVGLLLLLVATVYRLPATLLKLRGATKRLLLDPAAHTPAIAAATARAGLTAKGGVRLIVRGTKPEGYAPPRLALSVGGRAFWAAAESAFGGKAAIGKTFLPLALAPRYLARHALKKGETAALLDMTFSSSRKTVGDALSRLEAAGDPLLTLQIQQGKGGGYGTGIAAQLCTRPSKLRVALGLSGHGEAGEADAEGLRALGLLDKDPDLGEAPCIQDVLWSVTVAEAAALALDAAHAVLALALIVAPWRQLQLLRRLLEPKQAWARRLALSAHALLSDEQTHANTALNAAQATLALQVRGGERDYPMPPIVNWWGGLRTTLWRPPPPAPTQLYTGHTNEVTGRTWGIKRALKELGKLDDELCALWERRLGANRLRHLALVLQAEVGRGVLVREHWLETRYALRRVIKDVDPAGRQHVLPPTGELSQAELDEEPRTLLARADELLAAAANEEAALRDQTASVAAARRQQLRCEVSPSAICKRSLGKSQAIVRWHLRAAALDYLTVFGGLLLLLSHRGPTLLKGLRGVRSWRSVTLHVAHQMKEVLLDAVLAAEALLITLTLYQAIEFWLEMSDALLYRGDVAHARASAHERAQRVFEDFCEIFLVWPFLYETYRFSLATLLFGTLVPVELVGRLVGRLCCPADTRRRALEQIQAARRPHIISRPRADAGHGQMQACGRDGPKSVEMGARGSERADDYWSYERRVQQRREAAGSLTQVEGVVGSTRPQFFVGALLWGGIVAFPVVLVLVVAPSAVLERTGGVLRSGEGGQLLTGLLGGYVGLILLIGLLSACAARSSRALTAIPYPRTRLRLTGANVGALLAVGLEAAQLAALPFLALRAAGAAPPPWVGCFGTLLGLADAVTVYIDAAEEATTVPLFWAAFGLACVWYLLFSLPVVIDELLKWEHEHGRVEDSKGWQLAVVHLRVTLHLAIVMQLLKPLGCHYDLVSSGEIARRLTASVSINPDAGSGFDGFLPLLPSSPSSPPSPGGEWFNASTSTRGVMQGAGGVYCWDEEGPHPTMALAALLALAFYLLTVHVVGDDRVLTKARQGASLDVRYSELYSLVANTLSIVAAASLGLLTAAPAALLAVLAATFALLLLWTLLYHRRFSEPPCCLRSVTAMRASGYAMALWAAVCCLLELTDTLPSPLTADGEARSDALQPAEAMLLAGWGVIVLVALVRLCAIDCGARGKRWAEAGNLSRCASELRATEERWRRDGLLAAQWGRTRRRWAWRARVASRVGELADCLLQLEQHVRPDVFAPDSGFVRGRSAWRLAVLAARTHTELEAAFKTLRDAAPAGRAAPAVAIEAGNSAKAALYSSWAASASTEPVPTARRPRDGCQGHHRSHPQGPPHVDHLTAGRVASQLRSGAVAGGGSIRWTYSAIYSGIASLLPWDDSLPKAPTAPSGPSHSAAPARDSSSRRPDATRQMCTHLVSNSGSEPQPPASKEPGAAPTGTPTKQIALPPPGPPADKAVEGNVAAGQKEVDGEAGITAAPAALSGLNGAACASSDAQPPTAPPPTAPPLMDDPEVIHVQGVLIRGAPAEAPADVTVLEGSDAGSGGEMTAAVVTDDGALAKPWFTSREPPPPPPAGLFSATVSALLERLHQADTNFERSELVEELRASELSCAEVSAIVGAFTFSSKRRAILISLYPKLAADERPGFVDVLEGALDFDFDRNDVMRELKLA